MNLQNTSIDTLRLFVAVSDFHSINKAAEKLYVDQSSISRRIRQLEQETSISLFDRSSKGVELTDAGLAFYQFAKKVLKSLRELDESLQKNEASLSNIRLGTFDSITSHIYPDFFGRELNNFKEIKISNDTEKLISDFNHHNLDALIVDSEFANELTDEYLQITLFSESFYIVYSLNNSNKELLSSTTITAEDLADLDVLLYPSSCPIHRKILSAYDKERKKPNIRQIDFATSAISFVLRTDMVTILPKSLAIHYITKNVTALGMRSLDERFNRHISLFTKKENCSDVIIDSGLIN
ncbi:LysR family transcriptional regulator [Lactococcus garvieae]|uniref:LysR family transcriptional regulator n=1 Tax=Lactococcus garvieae TaxID=1363 RepID=UPI003251528E